MEQIIDSFVETKIIPDLKNQLQKLCLEPDNEEGIRFILQSVSKNMDKKALILTLKSILFVEKTSDVQRKNASVAIPFYLEAHESRDRSLIADELFTFGYRNGVPFYVQKLINYGGQNKGFLNVHKNNEDAFRWALRTNDMETVQILLNNQDKLGGIDINANNDQAFRECAVVGNLEAIKFLYDLAQQRKTPVNINTNKNEAFYRACTGGYLDVAQWIYQKSIDLGKKIDIRDGNHRYLNDTLKAYGQHTLRNLTVADWLSTLH